MKRFLLTLAFVLTLQAPSHATLPASDNFNRADANPIGGNWTAEGASKPDRILSNQVQGSDNGDYNASYWNADAFGNDQYSEIKIVTVNEGGPTVRNGATGANNFYWADVRPNEVRLYKHVAGVQTQIGSDHSRTNNNGETWRLTVVGTTLTVSVGGVDFFSDTDSALTSGAAGFADFGATTEFDDWTGGNAGAGAASMRHRVSVY